MILPTERHQNQTFAVLEDRRRKRIEDIERQLNSSRIVDSSGTESDKQLDGNAQTNCSFYGRLIVWTVSNYVESVEQILDYERELAEPTGRPTIENYPLQLEAEMISINCNCSVYFHTNGLQMTRYWLKTARFLTFSTILALVEIFLLIRQLRLHSQQTTAVRARTFYIGNYI